MQLTQQQQAGYKTHGYVLARNFVSPAEIEKHYYIATTDCNVKTYAFNQSNHVDKKRKLTLWSTPRQRCVWPAYQKPPHGIKCSPLIEWRFSRFSLPY